jgi:AAHS family 3-hydroxyphenylpropionic acid transporter
MHALRSWISSRIHNPRLIGLAILLGLFEGADITSMGYALSRISKALSLNHAEAGLCASASMLGLVVGAAFGGRLSDTYGRRPVMVATMTFLGVGSISTALAWNFESLLVVRLLTGLGIGGLMPVLLSLARDAAVPTFRSTAMSLIMASGPFGGSIGGLVALHPDWRFIFIFGGTGPLVLVPVIWFSLRGLIAGEAGHAARNGSVRSALLGDGRATGTMLIWAVAFATTVVSYILFNWLPSLLVQQGFSETQSQAAMIVFTVGGIAGNLAAGIALDRNLARAVYAAGYLGAAACIFVLSLGIKWDGVYLIAFATSFCILAAQFATYALTPIFYPDHARTTGVGAMISAGRSGSVVGPMLAGALLQSGLSASQLLLCLIPAYGVTFALALGLEALLRKRSGQTSATAEGVLGITG